MRKKLLLIYGTILKQQKNNSAKIDENNFLGTYTDQWFGDVTISKRNDKLWFTSKKSFLLNGEMLPYKENTFVVKWGDRSLDADAFVMFDVDEKGKATHMTMKPISPLTDFSFDFQDLDFTRAK